MQFVSHPFLFKRVKRRWQRGSPFKSAGVVKCLLWLLVIMLETIFTPFLLPVIAFVSYRDQTKRAKKKKSDKTQGNSVVTTKVEDRTSEKSKIKAGKTQEVGRDNENLEKNSEDARQTEGNSVVHVTTKVEDQTSEKSKKKVDGKDESKEMWGMIRGRATAFPFFDCLLTKLDL